MAFRPAHPPCHISLGPAGVHQLAVPACLLNRVQIATFQVLHEGGQEPLQSIPRLEHERRHRLQPDLLLQLRSSGGRPLGASGSRPRAGRLSRVSAHPRR